MNDNDLTIKIYSSGLSEIVDLDGSLANARVESFGSVYPGGRYTAAKVFVPRRVPSAWNVTEMQRVAIYNGRMMVWEGEIVEIGPVLSEREMGYRLECIGKWGIILSRTWNKPWADQRLGTEVWIQQTAAPINDRCALDRTGRLRIVPNGAAFATDEYFALRYTAPIGQTVKRITYAYDLNEVAITHPARAKHYQSGPGTYTPLPLAIDADIATSETISLKNTGYLYIGVENPDSVSGFRFDFGATVNANTAALSAYYSDTAGGWTVIGITDGTSLFGVTFAKDGDVTFNRPEDWQSIAIGGSRNFYYLRFAVDANLTDDVIINEIQAIDPQAWELVLYNVGTSANEAATSVTASGTGTIDRTLGTPSRSIELRLVAKASQTCPSNGSVYGQFSSVMVYTETGAINPTEIMKDIRAHLTDVNSDETHIGSNTFALTPFISNGQEAISGIAQRAAAVGDASFNAWAAYLDASDKAATPDGTPVLCFEAYPSLSDWDYAIRLGEANVLPPVEFKRTIVGTVFNWIAVRYRDELNNVDVILTPDDDATLKNAASIALYHEQHIIVDAGQATATTAKNYAKRVLAAKKDAKYKSTGPIMIQGTIRTPAGVQVPVCRVCAGKRIKIENYLSDRVGIVSAGLTFIVTAADYDPARETVKVSLGVPDNLAVFLAQKALLDDRRVV